MLRCRTSTSVVLSLMMASGVALMDEKLRNFEQPPDTNLLVKVETPPYLSPMGRRIFQILDILSHLQNY